MELTDWLVALHVLSAFAWISALVALLRGHRGRPGDERSQRRDPSVPSRALSGDALIAVGMIGTIVFGIWLALDEYEIWDGWIIAALVLWLVAAAVGGRVGKVYNATRDRAKALLDEGRDGPSTELSAMLRSQRGLILHAFMILVTLAILVVMVYKPGA